MTRTEAPKDLLGRGWRNLARTTPELPADRMSAPPMLNVIVCRAMHTVRAGNLAPDNPDPAAANLLLRLVDVGDLLAEVEAAHRVSENLVAIFVWVAHTWQLRCCRRPRSEGG